MLAKRLVQCIVRHMRLKHTKYMSLSGTSCESFESRPFGQASTQSTYCCIPTYVVNDKQHKTSSLEMVAGVKQLRGNASHCLFERCHSAFVFSACFGDVFKTGQNTHTSQCMQVQIGCLARPQSRETSTGEGAYAQQHLHKCMAIQATYEESKT